MKSQRSGNDAGQGKDGARQPRDLDSVGSFAEWCVRVGVSPATGRRLIASGRGPRVTWLSERRMGIRERDHITWLDSCAVGAEPAAAA
jgi:hypothetical protein